MKLLRRDLSLQEFRGNRPAYAVLSHTWGDDEFTYEDMCHSVDASAKAGYRKIRNFARTAAAEGLEYFWADTCCIDGSSSSELQESINSMFQWYEDAALCLVYLEDFEWSEDEKEALRAGPGGPGVVEQAWVERFWRCRWFTRAWTLQELLAPKAIEFYDRHWTSFGSLVDHDTLQCMVEVRTRIPRAILRKEKDLRDVNIATRMCWAAGRLATKPEDVAYSLLGVFDVNLPLIYGEGREKAFLRLQKEIMAESSDESLFAWSAVGGGRGLLAQSPDQFQDCSECRPFNLFTPPWIHTNAGLQVSLCMREGGNALFAKHTVFLNCVNPRTGHCPSFRLYPTGDRQFARSGKLVWEAFPLASANALRREVIVKPVSKPQVPAIRFDCSAAVDHVSWNADSPTHGWVASASTARTLTCRQPAPMHDVNSYVAMIQLRERARAPAVPVADTDADADAEDDTTADTTATADAATDAAAVATADATNAAASSHKYGVTTSLEWDGVNGEWKCAPRIHRRGTGGWKKPSDSAGVVISLSQGTASNTYRTSRGYSITASVPRTVGWHYDGIVCVQVSVRLHKGAGVGANGDIDNVGDADVSAAAEEGGIGSSELATEKGDSNDADGPATPTGCKVEEDAFVQALTRRYHCASPAALWESVDE